MFLRHPRQDKDDEAIQMISQDISLHCFAPELSSWHQFHFRLVLSCHVYIGSQRGVLGEVLSQQGRLKCRF